MAEPLTTVDDLLAAAARAHPKKTAIRADYGDITYGEIDRAATMCAAALRGLLGEERCVIAVASPLHPDFMVGFYGTIRSGNIAAPVNPLLPPHILHHLLSVSQARLAFVTSDLFTQLRRVRDRLPDLREAVLVGPGPVSDANDIRTIDDLSAAYEVRGNAMPAPPRPSADDVACIQFTSGTTGLPRGVLLSHRNLTVNAAQVAEAHGLGPDSVVLNHLPKFHLMHMNGVVHAGAVHVPCTAPENRAALEAANAARASHFYTIPMRLNRLADDPELPGLRLDTVRMIASGGSALSSRVGALLTDHFGVPVFQGYGLAETSPLTHSAGPEDPRHGSVGRTVRDTECRIVDLKTRQEMPAGGRGEVLVRGPQVMRGYLDPEEPTGIDADGWLATGDIGHVGEDGFLYVVDRIKDLFKCDNYLVSPAEIETLLDAHPLVRESAAVGYPDGTSGEVCHAFVALHGAPDDPGDLPGVLAGIAEDINRDVPYYQRIRHIEAADALPRSPNGKVPRRELRAELITRKELTVRPASGGGGRRGPGIVDEARDLSGLVTAVGRFAAKGDPKDFEKFFLEHVEFMRAQEGFVSQHAVRLAGDASIYLNFGWWTDQQAFLRVVQSAEFRAHQATMRSMLEDAEVDPCKGLFRVRPPRPAGERKEPLAPLVEVTSYRLMGAAEEFEAAFVRHARSTRTLPGFGYADLSRSLQGSGRYTGIAYWWDPADRDRALECAAWRQLRGLADVRTERVEHVAWNDPAR
ncbi:AMP-binding protein [Streptomyces sp. NPDC102381]|uniref:AMP-binding protein n=1 Tax=Streptomyces sp. NPDC102381 TaxID=3366164 RepID=UPI0037FC8305